MKKYKLNNKFKNFYQAIEYLTHGKGGDAIYFTTNYHSKPYEISISPSGDYYYRVVEDDSGISTKKYDLGEYKFKLLLNLSYYQDIEIIEEAEYKEITAEEAIIELFSGTDKKIEIQIVNCTGWNEVKHINNGLGKQSIYCVNKMVYLDSVILGDGYIPYKWRVEV